MWSLLHRGDPQCRHSGNLLALGRQHKIGIIAVDYGTQWVPLLKDSFILEKETLEGERERGALVPPLLSHGGHRHDISGLKELAFWTCPLPPTLPLSCYTLIPPPPPSSIRAPSLLFFAPASLDAALGRASWGHCRCLRVKQSLSEGRERKQRASHGTSQEQGWLPQPSPLRPLFWLRGAGVTPVPLSPPVSLLQPPPPVTPSSLPLVPRSHP